MKNPLKMVKPFLIKHEPEVLITTGVIGLIFSTVSAIRGTIKAVYLVEEKKKELEKDKLTKMEVVKTVWKCYIPTVATTLVSIPCVIAGTKINNKRNAAIVAAYTMTEQALQEYQEKTKEIVGEEKAEEISEAVVQDKIDKQYTTNNVILTGDGDVLFFEPLTGRFFKSNWNYIQSVANRLNAEAISDINGTITLSEWFCELGLEPTENSDEMGWTINNGTKSLIDVEMSTHITKDNKPCGAIKYYTKPIYF